MEWWLRRGRGRGTAQASRRVVALALLATAAALPATQAATQAAGATPGATPVTQPVTHPDTSPPSPEQSPFSGADNFCTPDDEKPTTTLGATMPGVTPTTVDAALLVPTAGAATAGAHFAELVNGCGGIQGRRLVLHTVVATGDPVADCTAVVASGAPVVVSSARVALDACVRANPGLLVVAPETAAANDALATTHGRLFVGASPEGPIDARVEDLVQHADLASSRFAVLSATGDPVAVALDRALAANGLRPTRVVDPASADAVAQLRRARVAAVLAAGWDPEVVRGLTALADAPTTYVMDNPPSAPVGAAGVAATAAHTPAKVQSWLDPTSATAIADLTPSDLATHCAQWSESTTTTTTTAPTATTVPAGHDASLTAVCRAVRLLARGLYMAGPNPTTRDLVRAFHNLPNTDRTGAADEPPARPNQLVNEPVRRVRTVVVRTELTTDCPVPATTSSTSSTTASTTANGAPWCWVPVSGYGDGGRAVDAPLTRS